MLCSEHPKLDLDGSKTHSPNSCKDVIRYLRGTMDYGLKYDANQNINLYVYVDSNWEGSSTNINTTLGCCFSFGSSMISWFNRNQSCLVLSIAKEEYVSAYFG